VVSALRASHAPRYAAVARLLLKHRGILTGQLDPEAADDDVATEQDASELAAELVRMGPTFVKLGQLLSTRADLLPPVYLEALSHLRDDVEPFAVEDAIAVIEEELGVRVSKAFKSFNRRPIGAASLGQVHKASLRDGRPVAVKVQRPGIREQALADMEVITELAAFLDSHSDQASRVGFEAMAEEFRRSLMDELDYSREAANLRILGEQLADFDRIVVPQPIDDFSTTRVLTMEYIAGRSVSSISNVARVDLDGTGLGSELIAAYLDQMLVNGFFHADPHPGNVLLTDDGRLALIDLGMVARLSPQVQEQLLHLVLAVSDRDGAAAAEALEHLSTRLEGYDPDGLRDGVSDLLLRYSTLSLGEMTAGRLLGQLAGIASSCRLRPRSELTMLAKALLNLDEVARVLDPEIRIDAVIESRAARIMRHRMLQAASPTKMMSSALEATAFAEALPGRLNKVLEALAEGKLTLNLEGLDEAALMRGAQKLSNRVATGVLIAAFVVAAALFSGGHSGTTVWGYPVLTIVFLGLAAATAVWLAISIHRGDLRRRNNRA
jgi:ubiquinone biosynthesis protein